MLDRVARALIVLFVASTAVAACGSHAVSPKPALFPGGELFAQRERV